VAFFLISTIGSRSITFLLAFITASAATITILTSHDITSERNSLCQHNREFPQPPGI
jgi:hypothetical protein